MGLVVFLLSIAGVSASEIGDTIASENANTIELSADNDIEDNLQTSEENEALASTDYDDAIAQTDTEVLGEDSAKYSDLAAEISQPGNINLIHKNYTYDWGETITISEDNKVIDGNGAVIDMNGSTIRAFFIRGSGVTIKNLTIKNANYYGNGGAIYFTSSGTVTNCNFADNHASENGGAIRMSSGSVSNCNFTNNTASQRGGAVCFVSTCNVTNCNFVENSASRGGGAIFSTQLYTTADTCIFKRNSGDNVNTVIYPPTLNVDNFTTVYGSGDKLTFDLKTNSSIPVTNGNISISDAEFQKINRTITITAPEHTFWFLNYTINGNDNPVIELSHDFYFDPAYDAAFVNGIVINRPVTIKGNGNAIDAKRQARIFYVQSANAVLENLTIINANSDGDGGAIYFSNSATSGTVSNCNFTNNFATVNGGAIYFLDQGTVTNCNFTDNTATYGGAVYFWDQGTVSNCNFVDNYATYGDGGAINMGSGSVSNCNFSSGSVSNCNFTDNFATVNGGAVYLSNTGTVTNCNFTDNNATYGGAVYLSNTGTVSNCNFTDNSADYGGAIRMNYGSVENCNFTNNTATDQGGAIRFTGTGTVTNCNFVDNSAFEGGAIFSLQWYTAADTCIFKRNSGDNVNTVIYPPTLNVDDFTTVYGSGEKLTFDLKTNSSIPVTNGNISISVYSNNEWVGNYTCLSGEGWIPDLPVGSYIAVFNTEYAEFQSINRTITITMPDGKYYVNVTSLATNNKTVNITAKTNVPKDIIWEGKLLFILSDGTADGITIEANYAGNGIWWAEHTFDAYGEYKVNATYVGLDNVTITNATIRLQLRLLLKMKLLNCL